MYKVYAKNENSFVSKKLIGEFKDIENAYEKVENELAKDENFKYVIEEISGYVNNYGELISTVVQEN